MIHPNQVVSLEYICYSNKNLMLLYENLIKTQQFHLMSDKKIMFFSYYLLRTIVFLI